MILQIEFLYHPMPMPGPPPQADVPTPEKEKQVGQGEGSQTGEFLFLAHGMLGTRNEYLVFCWIFCWGPK